MAKRKVKRKKKAKRPKKKKEERKYVYREPGPQHSRKTKKIKISTM